MMDEKHIQSMSNSLEFSSNPTYNRVFLGCEYVKETLEGHEQRSYNIFRMSVKILQRLLNLMQMSSVAEKKKKSGKEGKKDKAIWDDRLVELYIKICIQEVRDGNRPTTHLNKKGWLNLQVKFNKLANKNYDSKQFKNKWENLKKDWQLWRRLIEKESKVRWNANKKIIEASDEWWDAKIKELPAAVKFREKGLLFADEMDILFGGVDPIALQGLTPPQRPLLGYYDATSQGMDENAMDLEGLGENGEMFLNTGVVDHLKLAGTVLAETLNQSKEPHVDDEEPRAKGKRRMDSSSYSTSWKKKQTLADSVSMSLDRLTAVVESYRMAVKEKVESDHVLQASVDIINSLPIEDTSEFFYECLTLLTKNMEVRKMLLILKRPEQQLEYLKRMMSDAK